MFDLQGTVQMATVQNPIDVQCARKLRETVQQGPLPHPPYNQKNWAEQFGVFRRHMKDDYPRIMVVLDWYAKNRKQFAKTLPTVKSVKQFRNTFDWIEKVMKKESKSIVEVSPRARQIEARLGIGIGWPKGCAEQVPRLIELSIRAHEEWKKKVSSIVAGYCFKPDVATHGPIIRFWEYARTKVASTDHFIQIWFETAFHSIKDWKEFKGDLSPWAFTPEHKRFDAMMQAVAGEYGDSKAWTRFKEAIA